MLPVALRECKKLHLGLSLHHCLKRLQCVFLMSRPPSVKAGFLSSG